MRALRACGVVVGPLGRGADCVCVCACLVCVCVLVASGDGKTSVSSRCWLYIVLTTMIPSPMGAGEAPPLPTGSVGVWVPDVIGEGAGPPGKGEKNEG